MANPVAETDLALRELASRLAAEHAPFKDRFRELLHAGLRLDGRHLNAKQLRELAGGGSQTTAQEAIEQFRAWLTEFVGKRITIDADIPPPLVEVARGFVSEFWRQAQLHARTAFDADRAEMEAQVLEARRNETAARETMEQQILRIVALGEDLQRAERRADAAMRERDDERARATLAEASLRTENHALSTKLAEMTREASQAKTTASEARADLERLQRAALEEREKIRHANMLELDRVRTDAKAVEGALRSDLGKALKRVDALATSENELSAQALQLRNHLESMERRAAAAEERAGDAERRLLEGQADVRRLEIEIASLRSSLEEVRHAHGALFEALRAAGIQGPPAPHSNPVDRQSDPT